MKKYKIAICHKNGKMIAQIIEANSIDEAESMSYDIFMEKGYSIFDLDWKTCIEIGRNEE